MTPCPVYRERGMVMHGASVTKRQIGRRTGDRVVDRGSPSQPDVCLGVRYLRPFRPVPLVRLRVDSESTLASGHD